MTGPSRETVNRVVKFPDDLLDKIQAAADVTERTFNGTVLRALRHGLPHYLDEEGVREPPGDD